VVEASPEVVTEDRIQVSVLGLFVGLLLLQLDFVLWSFSPSIMNSKRRWAPVRQYVCLCPHIVRTNANTTSINCDTISPHHPMLHITKAHTSLSNKKDMCHTIPVNPTWLVPPNPEMDFVLMWIHRAQRPIRVVRAFMERREEKMVFVLKLMYSPMLPLLNMEATVSLKQIVCIKLWPRFMHEDLSQLVRCVFLLPLCAHTACGITFNTVTF
jgi:hypothetical protein